jgi:DNA-binding NtrC family response regulator
MNSSCRIRNNKGKILLVARDPIFIEVFTTWMTQERFDFALVEFFEEVIPALHRDRYDVVVPTNMGLVPDYIPGLIIKIKTNFPHVGIFVISGWTDIKEKVILKGAEFHEAPIPLEEFSSRLKKIVTQKRQGLIIDRSSLN